MRQLFVEILTEEVPFLEHQSQSSAVKSFFEENKDIIKSEPIVLSSPTRLVIIANDLNTEITFAEKRHKGPSVDSKQEAVEGFLKKLNIKKEDLKIEGGFYIFYEPQKIVLFEDILKQKILESLFDRIKLGYTKTMFWNSSKKSWIRPVKNLLIMFNQRVIDFEYAGLNSCSSTIINNVLVSVENYEDYLALLSKYDIVLEAEKRLGIIQKSIKKLEEENNITCISSLKLMQENSFLAESPTIFLAKFSTKYLNLPPRVLIESLEKNQKYFLFKNAQGELCEFFAICINGNNYKNVNSIIEGNKTVLNARLEDALYYIKIDLRKSLFEHLEDLKNVSFHQNAGSVYLRIERMENLLAELKPQIEPDLIEDLKIAVKLCKADLTTELVQSFPALQGYIGSFYAQKQGIKKDIAQAIERHYVIGIEGHEVASSSKLSLYLALIEKIEKIETLLKAGEKPTSSRDPFGIRRDCLAVIKIAIEGELDLGLQFSETAKEIIFDRLDFYFKNIDKSIKEIVLNNERHSKTIVFKKIKNRIFFLNQFKNEVAQFKRVENILNSKEAIPFKGYKINNQLLTELENDIVKDFSKVSSLEGLLKAGSKIETFFKNCMIIDEAQVEVSKNRIAILTLMLEVFNKYSY